MTSRRLKAGDILSLNCFPMIAGYYTALERTLFFGQPSDEQLRCWEINCEVHRRGQELIRPAHVVATLPPRLMKFIASMVFCSTGPLVMVIRSAY